MTRSLRADGRQRDRARLDKLWARKVKTRASFRCALCGSGVGVEAAHIFSRRYAATRWDLSNGIALCYAEHRRFTKDPLAWAQVMTERMGEAAYEALRLRSLAVVHPDLDQARAALEAA